MPFDPALPANNSPNSSAEMRAQLTALKALIDAVPVTVTSYGRMVGDWTSSSSSFSDVSGLSFAVGAGESWTAEIVAHVISGSSGQGLKFRVTGPGASGVMLAMMGPGSSGTLECEVQTAFSVASPAKTFCSGSSLTGVMRIHLVVANASAAGNV